MGNGLVYWAYNCFADELFPDPNNPKIAAQLKRKPTAGGTERTIQSIPDTDLSKCNTFRSMISSNNALYYLNELTGTVSNIERIPLSSPFTTVVVKALPADQKPSGLIEANGYFYWGHSFPHKIYRMLKNGTGAVETVADTSVSLSSIVVVGSTVFWIDSDGLKSISIAINPTTCPALPCGPNPTPILAFPSGNFGYGLVFQPPSGSGINRPYRIYWVQGSGTSYRIRFCSFGGLMNECTPIVNIPLAGTAPDTTVPDAPSEVKDFYVASAGRRIGSPIFANSNLFWTESAINVVTDTTGEIRRRAAFATTAMPSVISTFRFNASSATLSMASMIAV